MDNGAASVEPVIDGMFEAMDQQDLDRLAARLTGVAEKRDGRWVLVQSHLSVPGNRMRG